MVKDIYFTRNKLHILNKIKQQKSATAKKIQNTINHEK